LYRYIRDLISGLRDSENFDRYQLAINTAAALIRRKTGFGTEVVENIEELAQAILGLQDKYNVDKFEEKQLQSMIAVLVAKPDRMGPWFARMLFDGDLSIAQRIAIITTMGLGARELAGFREEDAKIMRLPELPDNSFPTKTLPDRLHATYSSENGSSLGVLTTNLSQKTLEPLALQAADQLTGPNALKVRTFSSRMDVEKKRRQREAELSKTRNKDATKILTHGFILPLTGRFGVALRWWT
jgi:telomere length regulation protein